jgi:hypothetical protein
MLSISLVGCDEIIRTETKEVEVAIVDSYYSPPWSQPIWTGKFFTYMPHPAIYQITVEYGGVEYDLNSSELYETYKNRIGETVTGILEIIYYDSGHVYREIVWLKE